MNENFLRSVFFIYSKCFIYMVLIYDFLVFSFMKVLGLFLFIVLYRVEVFCYDISVYIFYYIVLRIFSYNFCKVYVFFQ